MKKLLFVFSLLTLLSCSDSDEFSSFKQELESSVYIERGSDEINGIDYAFESYFTFDFSRYAYKRQTVTERPSRSDCYSTYTYGLGNIISESDSRITYLTGNFTYTFEKQGTRIKGILQLNGGSPRTWYMSSSSSDDFIDAIEGKRSGNTCN